MCFSTNSETERDGGNSEMKINLRGDFPGGPVVKTLPSNAGGAGSISGQEAKIPHASQRKKNPKTKPMKQKQYGSKFNKEF